MDTLMKECKEKNIEFNLIALSSRVDAMAKDMGEWLGRGFTKSDFLRKVMVEDKEVELKIMETDDELTERFATLCADFV